MCCIVPISGMEFRLSWQLAAIWLGGLAYAALLTNWWLRLFWLLCLWSCASILPPWVDSYIDLLLVALGLAAIEAFSRIDGSEIRDFMGLAAAVLLIWMSGQILGLIRMPFPVASGNFNPDSASCVLALCLVACIRSRWRALIPGIVWGLVVTHSTTGILAAIAGTAVYAFAAFTPILLAPRKIILLLSNLVLPLIFINSLIPF